MTSSELRRELSVRNLAWARQLAHEATWASTPCVVHAEQEGGGHGNFHPASWRRIQARPAWRRRLRKSYTAGRHLPRAQDRTRGELECANSSDALLMNVFCYPGLLRRPAMTALLGTTASVIPEFGVRAAVPLLREDLADRTEVDMRAGDLLLEAKLTESSFQTARPALVLRYRDLAACFDIEELPRTGAGEFVSYQLIRGVLAAHALQSRFAVVLDIRRADLVERWLAVLSAVRSAELRSRLQLVTWQEVARAAPVSLQQFLAGKYGIAG